MERNCTTCHHFIPFRDPPCFGKGGCYYSREYICWQPKTNGDMVREKSDDELASLLFAYQKKNVPLHEILAWLERSMK